MRAAPSLPIADTGWNYALMVGARSNTEAQSPPIPWPDPTVAGTQRLADRPRGRIRLARRALGCEREAKCKDGGEVAPDRIGARGRYVSFRQLRT
jgi:hypothetical protein